MSLQELPKEELERARAIAASLRKRYGSWVLAIFVIGLIFTVLPLPTPLLVAVASVLILGMMYIGLTWHIRLMSALKGDDKREEL